MVGGGTRPRGVRMSYWAMWFSAGMDGTTMLTVTAMDADQEFVLTAAGGIHLVAKMNGSLSNQRP